MSTSDWILAAVQIASVVIVGSGIVFTAIGARNARDTTIVIELGREYREKWETGGRDAVETLERNPDAGTSEQYLHVTGLLNWIDWLGILMKHRLLSQSEVIMDTIGWSMGRVIALTEEERKQSLNRYGRDYWSGVDEVASRLPAFDFRAFRAQRHAT